MRANTLAYVRFAKLSPVFFLGLNILLLFQTKRDVWDSVIFQFSKAAGNWNAWHRFLNQSGWEIFEPTLSALGWLGGIFGGTYFLGFKILGSAFLIWLFFEFKHFYNDLGFSTTQVIISQCLFFSSPLLTSTYGSPMTWHLATLPIAFAAVRTYRNEIGASRISGLFLMSLAFTINTWMLLIPFWIVAHDAVLRGKRIKKSNPAFYLVPTFLSIAVYFLQNEINPKFGMYENYNQVSQILSEEGFASSIRAAWFYLLLGLPAITFWILSKFDRNILARNFGGVTERSVKNRVEIYLTLLIILSAVPYVLVGKAPVIYESWDWSGRHGLIFMCFFSAIIPAMIERYKSGSETYFVGSVLRGTNMALIAIVILAQTFVLVFGYVVRDQRMILEGQLIDLISKEEKSLTPGKVEIIGTGFPLPNISNYEANWIMYQATKKPVYMAEIRKSGQNKPNEAVGALSGYESKELSDGIERSCQTQIYISAAGYSSRTNPALFLPSLLGDKKSLRLTAMETECK